MPGLAAVPNESLTALTEGDRILVIISNTPPLLDRWSRRLNDEGLTASVIESHRVPVLASGFTIYAWSVSRHRNETEAPTPGER